MHYFCRSKVRSVLIAAVFMALWLSVDTGHAAKSPVVHFPEGERILYNKILVAYQSGRVQELDEERKKLEKFYPHSLFTDNAHFLVGKLLLEKGLIGEAIRSFQTVIEQYPGSEKRAEALLAKSIAYRKLELKALALQTLEELVKVYPGSPESQRAKLEVQFLKQTKSTQ